MKRQKISVLCHFNLFPLFGGGFNALIGLQKSLSAYFDVSLIFYDTLPIQKKEIRLSDYMTCYSLEGYSIEKEFNYSDTSTDKDISGYTGLIMSRFLHREPELVDKVKSITEDSDIVFVEEPYAYRLAKAACKDKIICYRSHNVEYGYWTEGWKGLLGYESAIEEIYDIERECCEESNFILTITEDDKNRLCQLYKINSDKILCISAGYDYCKDKFVLPSKRMKPISKHMLTALLLSHGSKMAVDSAERIMDYAREIPWTRITIAGSVGLFLNKNNAPENVAITGIISNHERDKLLSSSDIAINPLESGSGINVKMLEYFASGLPVITTPYGVRGINAVNGRDCLIADIDNIGEEIRKFVGLPVDRRDSLAVNARELLLTDHSWENISKKIIQFLTKLFPSRFDGLSPLPYNETALHEFSNYLRGKGYYIWGAGKSGKLCLDYIRNNGITTPLGFIDNDIAKQGQKFDDITIYPPERFFNSPKNTAIIIAIEGNLSIENTITENGIEPDRVFFFSTNYDLLSAKQFH